MCFPLEAQRVELSGAPPAPIFDFGWLYLNLNVGIDNGGGVPDFDPGADGTLAQSYVEAGYSALGSYSVGLPAVELSSACIDADISLFDEPAP